MAEDERFSLPSNLPVPEDDGEADHLPNSVVPDIPLSATNGEEVVLSDFTDPVIVYGYPKTGRPDKDVTPEYWEEIPGARGCTPESLGFRDHYQELLDSGFSEVFGLSVQSTPYQREARDRLNLPFELLSDASQRFIKQLGLPTFEVEGDTLLKRLTLIVSDGHISHVFYPVYPPDEHAEEVLNWADENI